MPQNNFAAILGIGLGVLIGIVAVKLISKKFFLFLSTTFKYPLKNTLAWVMKDTETLKRIAITIGLLVGLHIISTHIQLSGLDRNALKEFLARMDYASNGMASKFPGRILKDLSIFTLGLMPFLMSCIILQIGSALIPALRRFSYGGEQGREALRKYTYLLTIVLSSIQAYFAAIRLEDPHFFGGMQLVAEPGMGFRLMTILTMTAAVASLLFIAELITQYGIGNGVAMISLSIILQHMGSAIQMLELLISNFKAQPMIGLILMSGFVVSAYFVFCLSRFSKAIEIQDKDGHQKQISLRPTIVGKEPVLLAVMISFLPIYLISGVDSSWADHFIHIYKNILVSVLVTGTLTVILVYVYALIVFDPKHIHDLINKWGYSLNKDKEEDLDKGMSKLLVTTAIILILLDTIPHLVTPLFKVPYLVADIFGASVLLIFMGVISDLIYQLEFLKEKSESSIKSWAICYVALDEIEATLKSSYLQDKGIPSLIEPLRFTWGLPIRTMVDQYRIYTSSDKKEEARALLKV